MTHDDDNDDPIAVTLAERILAFALFLLVCIALVLCAETGAMR